MSSKGKRLGLCFLAGIFVFGSAGIAMAQHGMAMEEAAACQPMGAEEVLLPCP